MKRFVTIVLLAIAPAFAQTPAPPNVVKVTKLILGVANLDRSVAFYRALGIPPVRPVGQPQALSEPLLKLVDVPAGTRFRNAVMMFPGADFTVELTEFSGIELHPGRPRIQDPGAALLIAQVRNVDAVLTRVKSAGASVVTPGGAPIRNEPAKSRLVAVRDPDGYCVAIVQPDALPAGDDSNVVSARWATTVQDAETTPRYLAQLGFETELTKWGGNDPVLTALGVADSQYRSRSIEVSGSALRWSIYEWKDIDRKPWQLRIPDPGAPAIGIEVRDLDAAEATIKAAGGSVITQGSGKTAFVRDPCGILLELAQPSK